MGFVQHLTLEPAGVLFDGFILCSNACWQSIVVV
jgi:hypothetical protein